MIPQRSFWKGSWSMLSSLVLAALLLSPALMRPATVQSQSTNGPWTFTPVRNTTTDISGSVNYYAQHQPYLSIPNRGCFKLVFTPPPLPPGAVPVPSTLYVPATTLTYGGTTENFAFYTDYLDSPYWGPIHRANGFTTALDEKGENWSGFSIKAGTSITITRVSSIPTKPQYMCTEGFSGADLSTQLSISRATQPVGGSFTTTVHVTNRGPLTASNVRTVVNLGSGLVVAAASPSVGTYSGGVWSISSLGVGQKVALTLTTRVASGTPGTALGISASASSSVTDFNTVDNGRQYQVMIGSLSASSSALTMTDPCPRGSRARTFTGLIDAEGQPSNNLWQQFFRRPVAQITVSWGGVCFNADGSINTTLTSAANYSVSIVPRSGWAAARISSSPTCSITASLARCEHKVRLTPPASERLNVSFDIGAFLHNFGSRFGISYSGTSSTGIAEIPVGMLILSRGETYAAGAGSQPLPGSAGNY